MLPIYIGFSPLSLSGDPKCHTPTAGFELLMLQEIIGI